MNAYDFDGTIYRGDSSVDFCLYAMRCHPALIRYLPGMAGAALRYGTGRISKTQMKQAFFRFFSALETERMTEDFWDRHLEKIYPWYLVQHREDDLVLSASPEFLLQPACDRLGIRFLIASRVDPRSGVFRGENCKGEEKVRRLREMMPEARLDRFYSDSLSDAPLAKLAEQAFLVKRGVPRPWTSS